MICMGHCGFFISRTVQYFASEAMHDKVGSSRQRPLCHLVSQILGPCRKSDLHASNFPERSAIDAAHLSGFVT